MAEKHVHDCGPKRGGRKKLWHENLNLTLPKGATARMDTLLFEGERRLDLIRAAIETELQRREMVIAPENVTAAKISPSWTWSAYGTLVSGTAVEMRLVPPAVRAAADQGTNPSTSSTTSSSAATSSTRTRPRRRSKSNSSPYRAADPRYNSWTKMKEERVPEWNDFETFARDVGEKPLGMMLLRHDSKQPHGPNNFFWGTGRERISITRRHQKHFYEGREWSAKELAARAGIGYSTFKARLKKMSPQEAMNPEVRWGPGRPKYKV